MVMTPFVTAISWISVRPAISAVADTSRSTAPALLIVT